MSGLYKNGCVKNNGPFKTVDALELATLSWVHWFNEHWLHSSLGYLPPVEYEHAYYRQYVIGHGVEMRGWCDVCARMIGVMCLRACSRRCGA